MIDFHHTKPNPQLAQEVSSPPASFSSSLNETKVNQEMRQDSVMKELEPQTTDPTLLLRDCLDKLARMEERLNLQEMQNKATTTQLQRQFEERMGKQQAQNERQQHTIAQLEQTLALARKSKGIDFELGLAQRLKPQPPLLTTQSSSNSILPASDSSRLAHNKAEVKPAGVKSHFINRRKLLKGMGLAGVSLVAASTTAFITQTEQKAAWAASGDTILLGNSNIATNSTYLSQTGGTTSLDKGAILVAEYNASTSALPSQLSGLSVALAGVSTDSTNSGIGGYFAGNRAPLYLQPMATPSGSHVIGEMYVDNSGNLFLYQSSGWVQANGGGSGPNFGGDLSSASATTQTVVGLQGRGVSNAAPNNGQVLGFNGTSWTPTTLTSGNYVSLRANPPVGADNGSIGLTGNVDTAGTIRSTGQIPPSTGAGVELLYYGPQGGIVQAYDRTPPGAWKNIVLQGNSVSINALGSGNNVSINNNLTINGTTTITGSTSISGNTNISGYVNASGNYGNIFPTPAFVGQKFTRTDYRCDFIWTGSSWVQTSAGDFYGSWPANPIANLRVNRQDLAREFIYGAYGYNGWMTMEVFALPLTCYAGSFPQPQGSQFYAASIPNAGSFNGLYVMRINRSWVVTSAQSSSNYYAANFEIVSYSSSSQFVGLSNTSFMIYSWTWYYQEDVINTAFTNAAGGQYHTLKTFVSPVGNPGTYYMFPTVCYRGILF